MKLGSLKRYGLPMVDEVASRTGVLRYCRKRMVKSLTILMYHKVLPDELAGAYPLGNLVVPASLFAAQMKWLGRHYEVLPVGAGFERLRSGRLNGRPCAAVSFDDGYRDNFAVAAPILNRFGLRATFFVTTGFLAGQPLWFDQASAAWQKLGPFRAAQVSGQPVARTLDQWLSGLKSLDASDRLAVLDRLPRTALLEEVFGAMRVEQIQMLHEQGHEIGSHSHSHPILTQLPAAALSSELVESRRLIGQWLGEVPTGICYPNGNVDQKVADVAADSGYAYGCTVRRGANSVDGPGSFFLRRRMVSASSTSFCGAPRDAMFAAEVQGMHDWMRRSKDEAG